MAIGCLFLRLVLVMLLTPRCGELARDCKFITCRDCTTMGCSWAYYFDRDPNCVVSAKGNPEVKSTVTNPKDCADPTCVIPGHDAWDAEGFAQLFGGIFGGLLAGLFGGAGIQNWRHARARGYERIGRQTWVDIFRAFIGACLGRVVRADDEAFLRGDDVENDARRQEAVERIAHRQAEARRAEEARRVEEARRAEEAQREPEPAVAIPPINQPQQEEQNAGVAQPAADPAVDPPADSDDSDDTLQADTDSDDDDGEGPGPAPVVQAVGPRRSERQAAAMARRNMAGQR